MNILCVGDVVGKPGRKALEELIPKLKEEFSLECVIVNAENAAGGSGITPKIADQFFRAGCDVLTMGDHVWDRPDLLEYFVVNLVVTLLFQSQRVKYLPVDNQLYHIAVNLWS